MLSAPGVKIDVGGYWYGTGLFYDEYGGNASHAAIEGTQYDARAIHWLDFLTARRPRGGDSTGGQALANFLRDLPAAVATNLDVTGDPYLNSDLVAPYATANEGAVAVLSLLDSSRVETVSPHYAARCRPYEESLTAALVTARDSDLVVLLVSGVPESDAEELAVSTEVEAVRAIARRFVDVDVLH